MELAGLTIHALHDKLVSGEVRATALTEAVLQRLEVVDEKERGACHCCIERIGK